MVVLEVEVEAVFAVVWVMELVDVNSVVLLSDQSAVDDLTVTSVPCVTGIEDVIFVFSVRELIVDVVEMVVVDGLGEEPETAMLFSGNENVETLLIWF